MTRTVLALFLAAALVPGSIAVATDPNTDADNTGRNVRDRDGRTLTPMDQGTSDDDVRITQQIRRTLTEDDDLSMDAKNVKIITLDRIVTLRGPVKSASERDAIAKVARATAGVQRVDNQLEVDAD